MNIEAVRQRLELLKTQQKRAAEIAEQAHANVQAFNGAIQDCEYWLAQLEGVQAKGPQPVKVKEQTA